MFDQTFLEDARALACAEALAPRWGVSQQFFETHRPALVDGKVAVAGIDALSAEGAAFVFLAVQDEPYHFWVRVEASRSGPRIAFVGYCPSYRVQLIVASPDLSAESLTATIGIVPSEIRVKGTPILNGSRTYPSHQWRLEPSAGQPGFLQAKLDALFHAVAPSASRFSALSPHCKVELSVLSRQWHAWPEGVHLTSQHVAHLQSLRASFDLDLYITGPKEPAA